MNFSPYASIPKANSWPGRRILRKMGYLSDQKGIINRYMREQNGWNEHLENAKDFVLQCLREARPSSVTVLGSGWLLDFPLEEALSICDDITLADIEHPPQIIRKIKYYRGARLLLEDITGGMIKNTYEFVRNARKNRGILSLEKLERSAPEVHPDTYYVSLNILNQLDILLVDYLQSYILPCEQEINDFRAFLQKSHISLLKYGGCLITDREEVHEDFSGKPLGGKNLMYTELPSAKSVREWTWDFDASGTYHPGMVTRMKVVALSC